MDKRNSVALCALTMCIVPKFAVGLIFSGPAHLTPGQFALRFFNINAGYSPRFSNLVQWVVLFVCRVHYFISYSEIEILNS